MIRYWTGGVRAVSPEAAIILRLLVAGKITIADIEEARE
jgi:hypothetical protein